MRRGRSSGDRGVAQGFRCVVQERISILSEQSGKPPYGGRLPACGFISRLCKTSIATEPEAEGPEPVFGFATAKGTAQYCRSGKRQQHIITTFLPQIAYLQSYLLIFHPLTDHSLLSLKRAIYFLRTSACAFNSSLAAALCSAVALFV